MSTFCLVTPLGSFSPRGHRLFGEAGSHGEVMMPPAPSVFAGAFKSALIGRDAATLAVYDGREEIPDLRIAAIVGTPRRLPGGRVAVQPGSLGITHLGLAQEDAGGLRALHRLPADVVAQRGADDGLRIFGMRPVPGPAGLSTSGALPLAPVLRAPRGKPVGDLWLTDAGLHDYLAGKLPSPDDLIPSSSLWSREPRLGIAMDGPTRTAAEGAIFTAEFVALQEGVGFLVGLTGDDGQFAGEGLLRFAGDGRAAVWKRTVWSSPGPPLEAISRDGRFRLILTTPGIFVSGWLPDAVTRRGEELWLSRGGCEARLVAAAVPRRELVSGWDLARWAPKVAVRAVPAGSVHWFDRLQGDPALLWSTLDGGLWADGAEAARKSEGYNRCLLAAWPGDR